jgi:hypothetical protein
MTEPVQVAVPGQVLLDRLQGGHGPGVVRRGRAASVTGPSVTGGGQPALMRLPGRSPTATWP